MPFNIEEIYNLLFQLNNAFKLFSENKILEYVTLDNIFIKEDKNKNLIFKLLNYFLEDRFRDRIISRFDRAPNINDVFCPPEIFEEEKNEYDEQSCLWSLGILIYTLFFKEYPKKRFFILEKKYNKVITGNDIFR